MNAPPTKDQKCKCMCNVADPKVHSSLCPVSPSYKPLYVCNGPKPANRHRWVVTQTKMVAKKIGLSRIELAPYEFLRCLRCDASGARWARP